MDRGLDTCLYSVLPIYMLAGARSAFAPPKMLLVLDAYSIAYKDIGIDTPHL